MTTQKKAEAAPQSLREAISRSKLTTDQIVSKVGCNRKSLSNWRNGARPSDYYIGRLSEALGIDLWPLYPKTEQKEAKVSNESPTETERYSEKLTVGGRRIDWIVLARDCYHPPQIHCTYDRTPITLPGDIEEMRREYIHRWEKQSENGETRLPYNSMMYKLKSFDVSYRDIIDGEEVPVLRLNFGPTDYFTQIITDLNAGNAVRDKYAENINVTEQPVPQFATIVGINLTLITSDNYLIIAERSRHSFLGPNRLNTSMGENMMRPMDAGPHGAPDPFNCAIRGSQEELGIELDYQDIQFGAFGVQPETCQYSLLGAQRINYTREEVIEIRRFGLPKDKWENNQLIFIPYQLEPAARFIIDSWQRWYPIGLSAVVLSFLQMGHTVKDINQAFSEGT